MNHDTMMQDKGQVLYGSEEGDMGPVLAANKAGLVDWGEHAG